MEILLIFIGISLYAFIGAYRHTRVHNKLDYSKPQKDWKIAEFIDRVFVFSVILLILGLYKNKIEVLYLILPGIIYYWILFDGFIGLINHGDFLYIGNRFPDNRIKENSNRWSFFIFKLTLLGWFINMLHYYNDAFHIIPYWKIIIATLFVLIIMVMLWKLRRAKTTKD